MPTTPTAAPAGGMLEEAWALDESVALRPEPFGALAYHFGTRKLSFLKTPELVDVVTRRAVLMSSYYAVLGLAMAGAGLLVDAAGARTAWAIAEAVLSSGSKALGAATMTSTRASNVTDRPVSMPTRTPRCFSVSINDGLPCH